MQNLYALTMEVESILASGLVETITLVRSGEAWNPIAAVCLNGIDGVPFELRIPIPDLYGFARSSYVVLIPVSIDLERKNIPGCQRVVSQFVNDHRAEFVDFRERQGWPKNLYGFCLTPMWSEQGFIHIPLDDFLMTVVDFMRDPHWHWKQDLELCERNWLKSRDVWWMKRAAQIQLHLGDRPGALKTLLQAQELYPRRKDIGSLITRVYTLSNDLLS